MPSVLVMPMNFAFIKSLYRASPVAFGSLDMLKDEIVYSSGHAEELLGYSPEELKKLSKNYFEEIVHPEDKKTSEETIRKLFETKEGEVVECTLRVKKADGEYSYLFIRDIVFERNAQGVPQKFTTIVQDISSVVELEKQLAEKVEAVKEISFKNSHELRAPVANIIGLVDLMKRDNFKTEFNEKIVRHLEETVRKLDRVIHEINELSNS